MAARLERELGIEVDRVNAGYGEYKVLVDGDTVVDGGAWVIIGVMPSARMIVRSVRERLQPPTDERQDVSKRAGNGQERE